MINDKFVYIYNIFQHILEENQVKLHCNAKVRNNKATSSN